MRYETRAFSLPEIPGISARQIETHLKLYEGYVTHVNKIYDELTALAADPEKNGHLMQELRRRLGFEFNGMRLHEFYFGDLEGGPRTINADSPLYHAINQQFGSFEKWVDSFKRIAARGSGWMMLNWDPAGKRFHNNWVDFHHEGQLATLPAIVALDLWEHAYMVDYLPGDKTKYIDAYLAALNWDTITARFDAAAK